MCDRVAREQASACSIHHLNPHVHDQARCEGCQWRVFRDQLSLVSASIQAQDPRNERLIPGINFCHSIEANSRLRSRSSALLAGEACGHTGALPGGVWRICRCWIDFSLGFARGAAYCVAPVARSSRRFASCWSNQRSKATVRDTTNLLGSTFLLKTPIVAVNYQYETFA